MTDLIEGTSKRPVPPSQLTTEGADAAVLLYGIRRSDSTALAYLGAALREAGDVGPVAMLHVNHQLRGEDADADERFVAALAEALDIPLFICSIDIAAEAERSRENVEAWPGASATWPPTRRCARCASTRVVRLRGAHLHGSYRRRPHRELLHALHRGHWPRRFPQHALPQRTRGASPARHHPRRAARLPLRLARRRGRPWSAMSPARSGARTPPTPTPTASAPSVRHKIVPVAKEWNSALPEVLTCSMNLIADEDDMLQNMAEKLAEESAEWGGRGRHLRHRPPEGFRLLPAFGKRSACCSVARCCVFGSDARPGCAGGSR